MLNTDALSDIARLVRTQDPDRFLCTWFAPAPRREAIFALLAYNHELARAGEAAKTPLLVLMRLQWWRDVVVDAAAGKPARRHEVAGPLHAAITAGTLDPAALTGLADAREVEADDMPGEAAFAAYLRGTAGGLAVALAQLLDTPAALLPAVQQAGALYGLAGVLRNAPLRTRSLLPPGATPTALAAAGLAALPDASAQLRALPRGAIAAVLPLVLARRDLRRLVAGRTVPLARGLGDRAAVVLAGLRGKF